MDELRKLYNTPGAPQGAQGLQKMLKSQGVSVSLKDVREFLKDQSTQQVHKKRKLVNLNVQTTSEPFEVWESDILHLQRDTPARVNKGYGFILVCVDKFSKMIFAEPLKKVDETSVTNAMEKILSSVVTKYKMRPRRLTTDPDPAFKSGKFDSLMKEFVIEHRFAYMAYEAERAIRLIKDAIARALSHKGNKVWVDIFDQLTTMLNQRNHRGLKMSPMEAMGNVPEARGNLETYWRKIKKKEPQIFAVGDHVRLREEKGTFAKGHVETFSHDVYKISHVFPPRDTFHSYRYGVEGVRDRVFTYNDLLQTSAMVTVSPTGKEKIRPKDRLQKQAEKELRDLNGKVVAHSRQARKPRGDEVFVEIPARKVKKRA